MTLTIATCSYNLPNHETLVCEYDRVAQVFAAEIIGADGNVMDELDEDGFAFRFGTAAFVKVIRRLSA